MGGFIKTFLFLLLTGLTGCYGAYKHEHIVGPYFTAAMDSPDEMCIIYNEKEDFSGGGVIIDRTVFEIEWNNNYIIVGQHPASFKRIITKAYRREISDSLETIGETSKLQWLADSLAKSEYLFKEQRGLFDTLKNKHKNDITFYYLIDVRTKSFYPTLLFSKQQLDSIKTKLHVGQLDNRIYYDYLDERE